MIGMLVAYDADGNIVATLDYVVQYDNDIDRTPLGVVDVGVVEESGGEMTSVWVVDGAAGSKVWPEWIGARAHDFRVELVGPPGQKRIGALVHKTSGYRRERAAIEAAIEAVPVVNGKKDIRAIVGGPERPLILNDEGRNALPPNRPELPLMRKGGGG